MASRKGELRVKVISAKGLRDTAIFGIQDPYVQVTCRQFRLSVVLLKAKPSSGCLARDA